MAKKVVRIVGHSKEPVFPFGENGPWRLYADRFIAAGYTIAENNSISQITHLVAHSHSTNAILEAKNCGVPIKNRILVIWEPKVVEDKIRSRKIRKLYGTVIYASRLWTQEYGEKFFDWPQSIDKFGDVTYDDWLKRENSAVMIQGNKYSLHKDEQYSLRRSVIKEFENSPQTLALYGSNWDAGFVYNLRSWIASSRRIRIRNWAVWTFKKSVTKYPNYLGEIGDKHQTNSRYRVTIAIENSEDYVSEKLFDALSSGTYVVYLGPRLNEFNLDGSLLNSTAKDSLQIKKTVCDFLAQSSLEQFKMMTAQRNSILNDIGKHDVRIILDQLATMTISILEHD
jgi:hypothetical protein